MEAFALREDYAGTITSADEDGNPVEVERFRGATMALRDGTTFDVGVELDKGGGVIRTADPELGAHLRLSGFLKEVTDPGEGPTVTPLDGMGLRALRELPEAENVTGRHAMSKPELIARLERVRAGEDPNVNLVEADGVFIPAPPSGDNDGGQS